jgi:hypothetical protein
MIAYNYNIDFIPRFKNESFVQSSVKDTLTIEENHVDNLPKNLQYEMVFTPSQGRELKLLSSHDFNDVCKEKIWSFEVKNVVTLFWRSGADKLGYVKHKDFDETLLQYWTLHVVLPVYFIIEGIYEFLHAGAVEIEGQPVLFIAKSFGGKSTMTDYFMKQGHTMISDDKVATFQKKGEFYAVSSHSYNRPYRNLEDLGFFVENFSTTPKPLKCMYLLEKAEPDAEITINLLTGIEKIMALRSAKEMNLFFPESKQLAYLSNIAKQVSLFKVTVPWEMERQNEVYNDIYEHCKSKFDIS